MARQVFSGPRSPLALRRLSELAVSRFRLVVMVCSLLCAGLLRLGRLILMLLSLDVVSLVRHLGGRLWWCLCFYGRVSMVMLLVLWISVTVVVMLGEQWLMQVGLLLHS